MFSASGDKARGKETGIAYSRDALPALKAQLEAVERGGAPTTVRPNRSGRQASTSGQGGNGHSDNDHSGSSGQGAPSAIPTIQLPPRPDKKWSLITIYDYYTKVKNWPVRLPLMATINFKRQREVRESIRSAIRASHSATNSAKTIEGGRPQPTRSVCLRANRVPPSLLPAENASTARRRSARRYHSGGTIALHSYFEEPGGGRYRNFLTFASLFKINFRPLGE